MKYAVGFLLLQISPCQPNIPLGPFYLCKEIKAGDLLTPITVLITVLTFAWTIRKDLNSRRAMEADRIRGAASKALGKLDRWKELALWYYRDIQPSFVETSDLLLKEFDVEKARDHLWTVLSSARIKSGECLLGESLETAYVELSSYYPQVYDALSKAVFSMKSVEDSASAQMLQIGQDAVLAYRTRQKGYAPPMLGNDLRTCAGLASAFLETSLDTISAGVRAFLIDVIKQADDALLRKMRNGTAIADPPKPQFSTIAEFAGSRTHTPAM